MVCNTIPLQRLERGTGPQLRTVTSQHIKLHGYRWVCVRNHSGQQIVIPFYVCEVKQPILSVTRLVEQGFQLTLGDNPRLQRTKGFNSTFREQKWPVLPTSRNHNTVNLSVYTDNTGTSPATCLGFLSKTASREHHPRQCHREVCGRTTATCLENAGGAQP